MDTIRVTAVFNYSQKENKLLENLVFNSSCRFLSCEESEKIGSLEDDATVSELIVEVPLSYTAEQWAEHFTSDESLKRCKLDSIVCIVDEMELAKAFNLEQIGEREKEDFNADQLADTLESSDLIVITSASIDKKFEQILRTLQTNVRIIKSSKLTLKDLINTQSFGKLNTLDTASWKQALSQAQWESKEINGLTQFAFHARQPFHPNRLWELIHQDWPLVYRSAGYFWIASRPETMYKWSQAGGSSHVEALGYWYAAVDQTEWPVEDLEEMSRIQSIWHPDFGDRAQEIAFIGEKEAIEIKDKLEKALLSEEELLFGKNYWSSYEHDPFPN